MKTTEDILLAARRTKGRAAGLDTPTKDVALYAVAHALLYNAEKILAANRADMERAKGKLSEAMLDRLLLTKERLIAMSNGVRAVAALEDPVGRVLESTVRPNGLKIEKVSVPFGVVAVIYESRPNVAADAAALCIKSGNVCVLRGGGDAYESSHAVVEVMREALEGVGLPRELINIVDDASQEGARALMRARGWVDLLIPRGGAGLIRACVENATVPCIETGTGVCHIYVDKSANMEKALDIVENAKASRPSVCNAAEVCLVHREIAPKFLPLLEARLTKERVARGETPVELRLDARAAEIIDGTPAADGDFDREFLDYVLAVAVVEDVYAAADHIARHSTGHSEAIVARDEGAQKAFLSLVDSAAVYVNASTRFTDGGEFGLGCEMGISTQKLHARGPMGLRELNSYQYRIRGDGQIRR
ncbi:MAG: glutamate-5-semialdehyde dehydrogenase [Clostridia bacterium]|nr:glutamate-5-semialdehyde dehydrogenase [Clostridia bacterium]